MEYIFRLVKKHMAILFAFNKFGYKFYRAMKYRYLRYIRDKAFCYEARL